MQLVTGQPVYVEDITPSDCLIIKLLRSPYASAVIEEIDVSKALAVPGIEVVYTYKDVPQDRFTVAGQTYPEPSAYDRLILDKRLREIGDPVAIVAGWDEDAVDKALKMIKVNMMSRNRCSISEKQRTIRYWFIRKITGALLCRWEPMQSVISWRMRKADTAMWMRLCRSVMRLWKEHSIASPITRP